MSGSTIVVLTVAGVLSLGAQQQPSKTNATPPQPTPPAKPTPQPQKVVSVELIVDTLPGHEKRCKGGKVEPTTVLIVGKEPYLCVKAALVKHGEGHDKFEETMVHVSSGQAIRWFSKATKFSVVNVQIHQPALKGAPDYPFVKPIPKNLVATEIISPPVRDVEGQITQRYKVSFQIEGQGLVDPDVVCSM
jgi:hypothetical protein